MIKKKVATTFLVLFAFLLTLAGGVFRTAGFSRVQAEEEGAAVQAETALQPLASETDMPDEGVVSPEEPVISPEEEQNSSYVFLSDLDWLEGSTAADKGLKKDKNNAGGTIQLLTEEGVRPYAKGISAHAPSQVNFDISAHSARYSTFTAQVGIDYSQHEKAGNGVLFEVWLGSSAEDLALKKSTTVLHGEQSAFLTLSVSGYSYLRLVADPIGTASNANWFDHALWANARLLSPTYDAGAEKLPALYTKEEYDAQLSSNAPSANYAQNLDMVREREFVDRLGYWNIRAAAERDPDSLAAIEWLLEDDSAMQLVIEAGEIKNAAAFLHALGEVYAAGKADREDATYGDVYERMQLALAVSYSSDAMARTTVFGHAMPSYDVAARYQKIKSQFDGGKFMRKQEFASYNMELMRMTMANSLPTEEFDWLIGYTQTRFENETWKRFNPYNWMDYKQPKYDYDKYYNAAEKEKWDTQYRLTEFGVPYGYNEWGGKTARTWMVMNNGGVCWNISRLGQNLYKTYGIACTGSYQPGHEVFLYYQQEDGDPARGTWSIGNNISGWAGSFTSWGGTQIYRMLLGWGNQSWVNQKKGGNNSSYLLLGQAALNRYEDWQRSLYYNLIAECYSDGENREASYELALEGLPFNLDSYDALIRLYEQEARTSGEWLELGRRVASAFTYFPKPMVDLLDRIDGHLTAEERPQLDLARYNALIDAAACTYEQNIQDVDVRTVAKSLLGKVEHPVTFSFDGEHAGSLLFNERYLGSQLRVKYSLDGGGSWSETTLYAAADARSIDLTDRLDEITAERDIQLQFVGSGAVLTIDILEGQAMGLNVVRLNDYENRFMGNTAHLEYSLDGGASWLAYDEEVRFAGVTTVRARYAAHGVYLAGAPLDYTYGEDSTDETKKYIPVKHISLVRVSSEETSQANNRGQNAVDASLFTVWHTKWGRTDNEKCIVVSFDTLRAISQIIYVPNSELSNKSYNGHLQHVEVYGSMTNTDGSWVKIGEKENIPRNQQRQTIPVDASKGWKYVMIKGVKTYGNKAGEANMYMSALRFDFFEDTTQFIYPEAEFSTTMPTNADVTVSVRLPQGWSVAGGGSAQMTIAQNGEYSIVCVDTQQCEHTILIKVDWIDKTAPTATVVYETQADGSVLARVEGADEEVAYGDGGGQFLFTQNGEHVFTLTDAAGNVTQLVARVDSFTSNEPNVDAPAAEGSAQGGQLTAIEIALIVAGCVCAVAAAGAAVLLVRYKRRGR